MLAGAFAPSRAGARMVETRAQNFFATATETRQETAPQVADPHQGNLVCGYELASGYSQAAESAAPRLLLGPGPKYNPWTGSISSEVTSAPTTMFRVWGDEAGQVGGWLTPTRPSSTLSSIRDLALPPGNSARMVSEVTVPAGTRIQMGTAGPAFGQPGGAPQILLLDRIPAASYGPGVPLGPR